MTLALAALTAALMLSDDPSPSGTCKAGEAMASTQAFLACARAGTERYRDHAAAVLDGYRAIGRDFPGMGEHWIRVSLVFDGVFDPAHPEILTYVAIDGTRQLLGAAYAVPLLAGEEPPDSPAGPAGWHDHSRTIEDETVLPHHHMQGSAAGQARLAMLHAWLWSPNPAGMFAADNWAIPFLRLQLDPGPDSRAAAAKALALATGGRSYFEQAIHAAATLSSSEQARVRGAMDRAVALVEAMVRDFGSSGPTVAGRAALADVWHRLWGEIDAGLGDGARESLVASPLR